VVSPFALQAATTFLILQRPEYGIDYSTVVDYPHELSYDRRRSNMALLKKNQIKIPD